MHKTPTVSSNKAGGQSLTQLTFHQQEVYALSLEWNHCILNLDYTEMTPALDLITISLH